MNWAFIKYTAALLLFGSNGVIAAGIALSSYEIVFLRTLIGSLLLIGLFIIMRGKFTIFKNIRQFAYLAASGAAMGASWMFLYEAYQQIGVSLSSLLYYCGPVIVMMLAPLLFREKLTRQKTAGFLAVLFGVILVNGQALFAETISIGLFCGAMSAVMYAVMVIFTKKAVHTNGLENPMMQLFFSFLTVAVFTWAVKGFAFEIAGEDILPILFLGAVNTGIGCYLYFSSIGRLDVQTVAVWGYLEPLSAVVFSVLLLGEVLVPVQIFGAVLLLGGAALGGLSGLFGETKKA